MDASHNSPDPFLFGLPHPGVLPRNLDVLIIAAKPDIGAIAVGEFQSLMTGEGDRDGASDARARLTGKWILHAVQTRLSAEPVIAIKRCPEPRFEVVAQVPLKRTNRILRLGMGARSVHVARKEIGIRGKEPHSRVSVENPIAAPALGIAKFGLEGPAVGTPVDQLRRIVLAGRSYYLETGAQQDFLPPFYEFPRRQGGAALKVDGDTIDRIQQAGTVKVLSRAGYGSLEVSYSVRQRGDDVGRAAKEAERVVITEDRYTVRPRGASRRDYTIEINAAVVEGPG